jgi:NaMN:DMB phosphoribosyltransferase
LLTLLALAVLFGISLAAAAQGWVSLWSGFDRLAMSVDAVDFDEDAREIVVLTTFVNESDERLQIHTLDTGLRLSGRSITAGSERFTQLFLEPGEEIHLETHQRVQGQELPAVREAIDGGDGVWNVSGRVQVSVSDLSDPLWLPFRYTIEAT